MRATLGFFRFSIIIVIVAGFSISARSQASKTTNDQTTMLVQMLGDINSAVRSGHYANSADAYKTISIRLFECAIAYRMLTENPGPGQTERISNETASDVFFRAGTALFPGDKGLFDQALRSSKDNLLRYRVDKDKKTMFYFLRSCKDFTNSDSVEGAVRLLL